VTGVKDAVLYTTLKNTIVAALLVGALLGARKWPELKTLSRKQFGLLLAIGAIGGSIPFALFFTGLTMTSALSGALIHKTLFLWVLLLAIPFLKERVSGWQWLGIGAIFAANVFVGGFTGFKFNTGEAMILGATILWAVENIIAKVALRDISSTLVAASRMVVGSVILLGIVAFRGGFAPVGAITAVQWNWTLLSSALLVGYVLTWYAALKRAPATYVATLLVPATLVTNILSAVFLTRAYTLSDAMSTGLFLLGIGLVVFFARGTKERALASATS
ncbi:MAG TPA: DMT family transporter, partial [Candidatus Paceibacterota bacterium]|nr:DMT family transporter [Candidatus Paceibacterota bacterium]